MLVKNALRFSHHFGGDGRLVIDAFLQHGWGSGAGWDQPNRGSRLSLSLQLRIPSAHLENEIQNRRHLAFGI
jgi:hypothetical protein